MKQRKKLKVVKDTQKGIARKHLRALLAQIEHHNRLYYQENAPEISDFEYDCLQAEVKSIYQRFPELEHAEGPGSDLKENSFAQVPHWSPMLSLANTYSKEEFFDFDAKLREKTEGEIAYVLEPKVDGMAINLLYKNGVFFKALTRGDGKIGEDVTENIKTIQAIPLQLSSDMREDIEVRGEVYISNTDFDAINAEQELLGLETFSNARNLASGSVKLLDVEEVRKRRLSFVAHGIGLYSDFPSQVACREWLSAQGFPVFPTIDVVDSVESAWTFIENFHNIAQKLPYKTDGVVVKLNDRHQQEMLGATAKSPRWAIAYKFEPESAETKLKAVTFQVGRTGVITPVAELEPVDLCGSRIARATLHNFDEIARKDIRIGDYVILQKAGEVIPAIVAVNKAKRSQDVIAIVAPKVCPACGAPLSKTDDEVALRCTSLECPEQLRLKIVHFASKEAMDIAGMGPKIVDVITQQGWVRHIADLFSLWRHRNAWIALEGFGVTLVDQLLDAIEQAKSRPLWRFIYGLSINGIGMESAKNLAKAFPTLEALWSASLEQLQQVSLVGHNTAQSIQSFYANATNRNVLEALQQVGLSLTVENLGEQLPWSGKVFVLTGSLQKMTRSEAKHRIERLGGKVSDSVTSKTFAVVVGENPGDKLKKAQTLNIPVWDEAHFEEALNAN